MKRPKPELLAQLLALGAGVLDCSTGLGLVFAPALTLRLMGVAAVSGPAETYLRFLGVFVGLVGFSYLWALRRGPAALRLVFELSVFFRLAAACFSTWAVATGRLDLMWWSVPATDFALAAALGPTRLENEPFTAVGPVRHDLDRLLASQSEGGLQLERQRRIRVGNLCQVAAGELAGLADIRHVLPPRNVV